MNSTGLTMEFMMEVSLSNPPSCADNTFTITKATFDSQAKAANQTEAQYVQTLKSK